ncbi:MAG: hypothetical protein NPIRA02_14580 [Nitrospirales bacterium]|nr:MAG: hypothetical protein NPIRA02_14580 [Nitrospirales bacterium]
MPYDLPLNDMTLRDKLAAMESLWDDLARTPEVVESPTWHKDILDERQQRLAQGRSQFIDWETAKSV